MTFSVDKPSSFYSTDRKIKILDENGNIFYVHPNRQEKITFNLPVGKYSTENRLKQVGFKPYVKFDHPGFNPFKGFTVKEKYNPHKASVIPYKKKIIMTDEIRFKDGSKFSAHEFKPCTVFLLGHEGAHNIVGGNKVENGKLVFDAESECDRISENYMLSHGYNPSQIRLAKQLLLSDPSRRNCSHHKTERR